MQDPCARGNSDKDNICWDLHACRVGVIFVSVIPPCLPWSSTHEPCVRARKWHGCSRAANTRSIKVSECVHPSMRINCRLFRQLRVCTDGCDRNVTPDVPIRWMRIPRVNFTRFPLNISWNVSVNTTTTEYQIFQTFRRKYSMIKLRGSLLIQEEDTNFGFGYFHPTVVCPWRIKWNLWDVRLRIKWTCHMAPRGITLGWNVANCVRSFNGIGPYSLSFVSYLWLT